MLLSTTHVRRALAVLGTSMLFGGLTAAQASAHAHVSPSIVQKGQSETYTVVVPTEGASDTTTVEVTVPDGFQIGSFEAAPGWKRSVVATGRERRGRHLEGHVDRRQGPRGRGRVPAVPGPRREVRRLRVQGQPDLRRRHRRRLGRGAGRRRAGARRVGGRLDRRRWRGQLHHRHDRADRRHPGAAAGPRRDGPPREPLADVSGRRRLIAAVIAALALPALVPASAGAHAALLKEVPSASGILNRLPTQVKLTLQRAGRAEVRGDLGDRQGRQPGHRRAAGPLRAGARRARRPAEEARQGLVPRLLAGHLRRRPPGPRGVHLRGRPQRRAAAGVRGAVAVGDRGDRPAAGDALDRPALDDGGDRARVLPPRHRAPAAAPGAGHVAAAGQRRAGRRARHGRRLDARLRQHGDGGLRAGLLLRPRHDRPADARLRLRPRLPRPRPGPGAAGGRRRAGDRHRPPGSRAALGRRARRPAGAWSPPRWRPLFDPGPGRPRRPVRAARRVAAARRHAHARRLDLDRRPRRAAAARLAGRGAAGGGDDRRGPALLAGGADLGAGPDHHRHVRDDHPPAHALVAVADGLRPGADRQGRPAAAGDDARRGQPPAHHAAPAGGRPAARARRAGDHACCGGWSEASCSWSSARSSPPA